MSVQLGSTVPDLTQDRTEVTLKFHEWQGNSRGILSSHPADFTLVYTTELSAYDIQYKHLFININGRQILALFSAAFSRIIFEDKVFFLKRDSYQMRF